MIVGEDANQSLHFCYTGFVSPDSVEPVSNGKTNASRPHEHETINHLRMHYSQRKSNSSTHRIADEMCALNTGSAQKIKQMRRPTLRAVRMLLRKLCIPKTNLVIGKDVQVLRERGKRKTPVCPGRSSWPRTMNEDDRASTACFVIIRVHTACTNEFSNLRCYRCLCHNTSCSSVLLLTLKLVSARACEHVPCVTGGSLLAFPSHKEQGRKSYQTTVYVP